MSQLKRLTKQDWDTLAEWIVNNTCGCVYGTFKGESLKENILK